MPEMKWISAAVPADLLKWYRAEAMRRTLKSDGPTVSVSELIRDALKQYRQRCELGSMPWPPAEAFHKAFVEKPAPVEAPADDHHKGGR